MTPAERSLRAKLRSIGADPPPNAAPLTPERAREMARRRWDSPRPSLRDKRVRLDRIAPALPMPPRPRPEPKPAAPVPAEAQPAAPRKFLCLAAPPVGVPVDRSVFPSGIVTLALTDEEAVGLRLMALED